MAYHAAGASVMIARMPSITRGVGVVLATNPIVISPAVRMVLLIKTPTFMGKFINAIVKALMLMPVFHSPKTTVSANNAVFIEEATDMNRTEMQNMDIKSQRASFMNHVEAKPAAASAQKIQYELRLPNGTPIHRAANVPINRARLMANIKADKKAGLPVT